jgi:hypothetical protein
MSASSSVAAALGMAVFSGLLPLLQRSGPPVEVPIAEAEPSVAAGVHFHAPAFPFSLRGTEPPVCPAPEPCARPLPLHRAGLRWLALYEGWLPEIIVCVVIALVLLTCCARSCATRRLRRRPVIRYGGRVVPAARARPALLG